MLRDNLFQTDDNWMKRERLEEGNAYIACFTYKDPGNGGMIELLKQRGVSGHSLQLWAFRPITYHIDVKTTTGPYVEKFRLTADQHKMVRHLTLVD